MVAIVLVSFTCNGPSLGISAISYGHICDCKYITLKFLDIAVRNHV